MFLQRQTAAHKINIEVLNKAYFVLSSLKQESSYVVLDLLGCAFCCLSTPKPDFLNK